MQSPIAVYLRVLVMLGCLVALPMAAFFGTSALPEVADLIFEGRWSAQHASARESGSQPLSNVALDGAPAATSGMPSYLPMLKNPGEVARERAALGLVRLPMPTTAIRCSQQTPAARHGSDVALLATVLKGDCREAPEEARSRESRLAALKARLDRLGASYQPLRPWGNQGLLYRFECSMSVPDYPQWDRHFEATDPDPVSAVARVVEEIESWKGDVLR